METRTVLQWALEELPYIMQEEHLAVSGTIIIQ